MKKSRTVSEYNPDPPRESVSVSHLVSLLKFLKDCRNWRDEETGKYTMVRVLEGVRKSKSSQNLEGSNKNLRKSQSSARLSRSKNKYRI